MEKHPHAFMISCSNLSKFYGKHRVLSDISHQWEEKKCHGIIGKSGAGKTTLLRCLAGLEKPDLGEVICDKKSPLGIVFQSYSLLKRRTSLENVLLPVDLENKCSKNYIKYAEELLERVGLSPHAHAYPSQLSGGQKQRVAIARSLILKPKILLCDELTSALDATTSQEILQLLKSLQTDLGLTIIMITHDLALIKDFADSICLLDQGVLIEKGATIDVLRDPQTPLAKEFVEHLYGTLLPDFLAKDLSITPQKNVIYRLHFNNQNATKPIVSTLMRILNTPINIISGNLDHIGNESLGHLIISLSYSEKNDGQMMSFFQECDVVYEKMGYLP